MHEDKFRTPPASEAYRKNLAKIDWSKHEPYVPKKKESKSKSHFIQSDIEPYVSPVSFDVVGSRRERREEMKRYDCIDARDFPTRANDPRWK